MPYYMYKDEIKVPRLTRKERGWIKRLENVLLECPERLGLVTGGDAFLSVIDEEAGKRSELCDGAAYRDGVVLATVKSGCAIQGVSV